MTTTGITNYYFYVRTEKKNLWITGSRRGTLHQR